MLMPLLVVHKNHTWIENMNKKLQTFTMLLLTTLSQSALSEPLFWHAEKGNKQFLILGSIHMATPEMHPLPQAIYRYLENSDGLIAEIDISETTDSWAPTTPPPLTEDILSNKQLQRLAIINQQLGYPQNSFLTAPAWQTALTLQVSLFKKLGLQQNLGIDRVISDFAKQKNIPIVGLESMAFQLDLFTKDPQVSKLLLSDTVDNWQQHQLVSQCLPKAWLAGDAEMIVQMGDESEIENQITELFIYQRNRDWANKLDSTQFLPNGRYLIVVGALHLVGEQNLLSLLSKRGFEVSQQSQSEEIACP